MNSKGIKIKHQVEARLSDKRTLNVEFQNKFKIYTNKITVDPEPIFAERESNISFKVMNLFLCRLCRELQNV